MFSVVITSTCLEWFMLFRVLECWSHNTQTYVAFPALAKLGITTSVKVHRLTYLRKVVQVLTFNTLSSPEAQLHRHCV